MDKLDQKNNKPKIILIRLSEVMSRTGYGRTSIYRSPAVTSSAHNFTQSN